MAVTQKPKLYRKVRCGDTDSDGNPLICGESYLQESLEMSAEGSVLKCGQTELITLHRAQQPVTKSKGSDGGFTRTEFDDGSTLDVLHRSPWAAVAATWSFNNTGLDAEEYRLLDKFLTAAGNHTLIRADDQQMPAANVIYGKINGAWSGSENIRLNDLSFSVKQEPGVTSL